MRRPTGAGRQLSRNRCHSSKQVSDEPGAVQTWSAYDYAALWIGMSVVITTYMLASGLMQQGMSWW